MREKFVSTSEIIDVAYKESKVLQNQFYFVWTLKNSKPLFGEIFNTDLYSFDLVKLLVQLVGCLPFQPKHLPKNEATNVLVI